MRKVISGFGLLLFAVALPVPGQQADRVIKLLEELSNAPAPSGYEGPVRDILKREFQAAGLDVSSDGMGSVIGVLRGPTDGPRIMLAAHMDEVGAIVRFVTPEGMVKFQLLGGWLDQALVDQRWTILTDKGPVAAVSGLKSVHVTPPEERTRVTPRDDVFLDVGAKSKEEAEALGIRPGDPIAPTGSFAALAPGRYVGKALDDRVGCVMLIETIRRLKEQGIKTPNTIYFVGTVQEEIGSRGAHTAVALVKPAIGLSLEAGIAADHPGGRSDFAQERLGAGPVIYLADAAMLVNLKLRDFLFEVGQKNNIPLQTEVTRGGYEDSAELQAYGTGVPAANIAVATRYLHAHNSEIERSDLDRTIDLLLKALAQLDARKVAEISAF
ncbi:MAG: M42 family metallopeptidase [Acidobacteriaceae bacterium]|nr:M42 family metallopeptidase [Acidobacteriaceae bacterium]MBV9498134.1 M42 family metallopeptidase [Acidobacteriaceae bacterium]